MKPLLALATILTASISNAETINFKCFIKNNPNVIPLIVNNDSNEILWAGNEIFKVFQKNKRWISAYRYTDYGTGVGTESVVFNRESLTLQFADLVHLNSPPGTDKVVTDNYKAQCKKET